MARVLYPIAMLGVLGWLGSAPAWAQPAAKNPKASAPVVTEGKGKQPPTNKTDGRSGSKGSPQTVETKGGQKDEPIDKQETARPQVETKTGGKTQSGKVPDKAQQSTKGAASRSKRQSAQVVTLQTKDAAKVEQTAASVKVHTAAIVVATEKAGKH